MYILIPVEPTAVICGTIHSGEVAGVTSIEAAAWSVGSQAEQQLDSYTHPQTQTVPQFFPCTKADCVCHTIIVDDGKNPTVRLSATLWDRISSNERSRASAICMTLLTFPVPFQAKKGGGWSVLARQGLGTWPSRGLSSSLGPRSQYKYSS